MGWIFTVKSNNFQRHAKKNDKRHHTSQAQDMQQPYTSAQKAPSTLNTRQPARLETQCLATHTSSQSPETCSLLQLHVPVTPSVLNGNSSSNPSVMEQWHHLEKHSWDKRHSPPYSSSTGRSSALGPDCPPCVAWVGHRSHSLRLSSLVTRQSLCQKTASTSAARREQS